MATKTKKIVPPGKFTAKTLSITKTKSIDYYLWAAMLVIAFISLLRWRLVDVPLERDEGEYAYMGKLLLNGILPYKEAYNMKLPGTYFMYALLMIVFGKSISGIHTGFMIMNAATMFIFFFAFRKLYNSSVAFFVLSIYGLMALSGNFLGFAAHATHFVMFFVSVALYFLARFYGKPNLLFALCTGFMFSLSFLMKQQAIFFILFGGLAILLPFLLSKPIPVTPVFKYGIVFSCGAILPYLFTIAIFELSGDFDKFWFWTVKYASKYASGLTLQGGKIAFNFSFIPMWKEFAFFWVMFVLGFPLVFLSRFPLKQKLLAVGFAFFGLLTVCPGLYFRQHYFVCLVPAIGLLSAINLSVISSFLARLFKVKNLNFVLPLIVVLSFFIVITRDKEYYLQEEPAEISKRFYNVNPFVESIEIGQFINRNTSPTDRIAVLGSEPEVYFYSDRKSSSGFLYVYPLVENQSYNARMQQEMITEIERSEPKFIVYCNVEASWLYHPGAPRLIYEWADQYTRQHYEIVGVVDETNPFESVYKWNEEAKVYQPGGQDYIKIYKRK